ncbi:MAG: outer membrane protein assembly factor BamC [Nitrosomonas sp.]|nr:outer membrane protein assembly factor BamC [Nitrosomonas sp.]
MRNRQYKHKLTISCLALLVLLSGCNLLPEADKINYKSAGKLPPLEIPPDLTFPDTEDRFTVPDINTPGSATFSAYDGRVQGGQGNTRTESSILSATEMQGDVRMARAGTQRWLVVPRAPEVVWPQVKEFWQDMGFLLKLEAPDVGIMETDWAENRAKIPQDIIRSALSTFLDGLYSTAERDKFRARLERSETGNTEIYISHRGMIEVLADRSTNRTIWQPRQADPELEAEMLTRMMKHFGVEEERAIIEVAASENVAETRAFIDNSREGVLIIKEAFDRAWRRVGLALDRVGFTVEDRDRTNGIYFVRYVSAEEARQVNKGEGLLSKIAFWKTDTDKVAEKYQIQVNEIGLNSEAVIRNVDGTPAESAIAKRITSLLYEQLK